MATTLFYVSDNYYNIRTPSSHTQILPGEESQCFEVLSILSTNCLHCFHLQISMSVYPLFPYEKNDQINYFPNIKRAYCSFLFCLNAHVQTIDVHLCASPLFAKEHHVGFRIEVYCSLCNCSYYCQVVLEFLSNDSWLLSYIPLVKILTPKLGICTESKKTKNKKGLTTCFVSLYLEHLL